MCKSDQEMEFSLNPLVTVKSLTKNWISWRVFFQRKVSARVFAILLANCSCTPTGDAKNSTTSEGHVPHFLHCPAQLWLLNSGDVDFMASLLRAKTLVTQPAQLWFLSLRVKPELQLPSGTQEPQHMGCATFFSCANCRSFSSPADAPELGLTFSSRWWDSSGF